ncbi:MAG: hypothetical protein N3B11_03290 [Coriobacteriia bacterium]|nr:hypothetical protein [Coriobacteriia bacterium]
MTEKKDGENPLVDLESKSIDELRALLDELHAEEQRVSYRRRVLHGKIDILRAELVRRLKEERQSGKDVVSPHDIERLIEILASDFRGVATVDVTEDTEDDETK